VTIDASKHVLHLNVPSEILDARRRQWQQPSPRYARGLLAKYARQVSCASIGALTDWD
jgi:dihydroxy-acid dehydratase